MTLSRVLDRKWVINYYDIIKASNGKAKRFSFSQCIIYARFIELLSCSQHNGICIIPNGIWAGRKKRNITDIRDIWIFESLNFWANKEQTRTMRVPVDRCAGEIKTMDCCCSCCCYCYYVPACLPCCCCPLMACHALPFGLPSPGNGILKRPRWRPKKKSSLNAFLFPSVISSANCFMLCQI